ncbi:hypothetical protein AB0P12_11370 [Streptomyces subrutilus]|uniref:hypothetical protein n=1 Tax=Streptomyces subrutilus TaxID=36818 RepID=UPI0033EC174B
MAHVWIMRNTEGQYGQEETSGLVRADAVTYIRTTVGRKVVVADVASQEVVTLADEQDGVQHGRPPLPRNFHTQLLARLNDLRQSVRGDDDEDRFVIAEIREGNWVWATYTFSELPQN